MIIKVSLDAFMDIMESIITYRLAFSNWASQLCNQISRLQKMLHLEYLHSS